MRTVAYSELLTEVARLMGWDPDNLDAAEEDIVKRGVNRGLAEVARRPGALGFRRCERRYYRDAYASGTTYAAGDEVYFPGTQMYYQALRAGTGNAPATASGSTWTENSAYWAECAREYSAQDYSATGAYVAGDQVFYPTTGLYYQCHTASTGNLPTSTSYWGVLAEFDAYVPAVQDGFTSLGRVRGVFDTDPRKYLGAAALPWCRSNQGLEVFTELPSVWVEYEMRPHRFVGTTWSASATYTPAEDEDATGSTIVVPSSSSLNYFASRTVAKASSQVVNGQLYFVDDGDAGFLKGWFLYDSTSAATADDSDVLAMSAVAGRLLRES